MQHRAFSTRGFLVPVVAGLALSCGVMQRTEQDVGVAGDGAGPYYIPPNGGAGGARASGKGGSGGGHAIGGGDGSAASPPVAGGAGGAATACVPNFLIGDTLSEVPEVGDGGAYAIESPGCDTTLPFGPRRPFTGPTRLDLMIGELSSVPDFSLSPDELFAYAIGAGAVYQATRAARWQPFEPAAVVSNGFACRPYEINRFSVSGDGLHLYVSLPGCDLLRTTRSDPRAMFVDFESVALSVNDLWLSPDAARLYYDEWPAYGSDIHQVELGAQSLVPRSAFDPSAAPLAHELRTSPALSQDELTLFYASKDATILGGWQVWSATRESVTAGFADPIRHPTLEGATPDGFLFAPTWVSDDACRVYLEGEGSVWRAERASRCAGEPVYLQDDPENCGWCGHSCLGGTCQDGFCQPRRLVSSPTMSKGVAFDARQLYWIGAEGKLWAVDLETGATKELFTSDEPMRELAADRGSLYFATNRGIARVSQRDGSLHMLACGTQATSIAVDGVNVFWLDVEGTLHRVAKDGSSSDTHVLANRPVDPFSPDFWLDGDSVYWTRPDGIYRSSKDLGSEERFLSATLEAGMHYAHDGAHVYWAWPNGAIYRGDKTGESYGIVTDTVGLNALLVDEHFVYWSSSSSGISKALKGGGPPLHVADTSCVLVGQDERAVYCATEDGLWIQAK